MLDATFHALQETGLIAAEGEDAVTFMHAQLTSDLAALAVLKTQYGGYCSPKGRLLSTFLTWRLQDRVVLQLPVDLSESIRTRLAKYILRAKVKLADAKSEWTLFGISGPDAPAVLEASTGTRSMALHDVVALSDLAATRVSPARYLILASAVRASALRAALEAVAREESEKSWRRLDIEAGVPWITQTTQDLYIPQMVNLDLIGGVSYSKGCYPGQEIVARTHYLGRLKQRMHRVQVGGDGTPQCGDPIYSAVFGAEQASGTLLNVAPHPQGGNQALAVIQTAAVREGDLHWKSPDGPAVELLSLPYAIPA